ncbi:MAG: hypothetical protein AB7V53_02675 [Dongiaceae bacterium]
MKEADLSKAKTAPGNEAVEFMRSDLDMIRVYEDLIDLLLTKRIINLTDFPPAAQEKLLRRKKLRSSLASFAEVIGSEEDGGPL